MSVKRLRSVQRAIGRSVGLAPRLRTFLAARVTLAEAEDAIKVALEQREEYFLKRVEAEVFRAVGSPYRPLFESVGCDYSDLAASVRRVGWRRR